MNPFQGPANKNAGPYPCWHLFSLSGWKRANGRREPHRWVTLLTPKEPEDLNRSLQNSSEIKSFLSSTPSNPSPLHPCPQVSKIPVSTQGPSEAAFLGCSLKTSVQLGGEQRWLQNLREIFSSPDLFNSLRFVLCWVPRHQKLKGFMQ